jgi:hypothetical protein
MEQWGSIDGYSNYEVSWWGRVRNATTGRILKGGRDGRCYLKVDLCKNGGKKTHKIQQLVAREWVPNLDGKRCVDHKDNDRSNNNWESLRYATHAENNRNANKRPDVSSVYNGVSIHAQSGKLQTFIRIYGKNKGLGLFANETEAAEAYNSIERELRRFREVKHIHRLV